MVESKCSLDDECYVINENKKQKKYTRSIACRNCNRTFHAYCAGWEEKTDAQLNADKTLFVCNNCNTFLDLVAEKVSQKVSALFDVFRIEIKELINSNAQINNEISNSVDVKLSQANESVAEIITHHSTQRKSNANDIIDNKNNSNTAHEDMSINNGSSVHNATGLQSSSNKEKQLKNCFLCSIENELSIENVQFIVQFILEDSNVSLENIQLNEVAGDFKNKRYIEVKSDNAVTIFKFKRQFYSSNLNGTWFVRSTPPKTRNHLSTFNNSTKLPQSNSLQLNSHHYNKKQSNNASLGGKFHSNRGQNKEKYYRKNWNQPNPNYPTYAAAVRNNIPNSNITNENHDAQPSNVSRGDLQHFLEKVIHSLLIR